MQPTSTPPNPVFHQQDFTPAQYALMLCMASYIDDADQPSGNSKGEDLNIQKVINIINEYGNANFSLAWCSDQTAMDNFAYIVRSNAGDYYLTIRGSVVPSDANDVQMFYNWIVEDLDVMTQVNWAFAPGGSAWIAQGAYTAFKNLVGSHNVMAGEAALHAYEFLQANAFPNRNKVYITGHSLGGNLAYTYASYVAQMQRDAAQPLDSLYLYTFAGPAPGNQAFVDDLLGKFPPERAAHFATTYDIVPKFPSRDSWNNEVATFFPTTQPPGEPPANANPQASTISLLLGLTTLQSALRAIGTAVYEAVTYAGLYPNEAYAQAPPTEVQRPVSGEFCLQTVEAWFYEVYHQHSLYNYKKGEEFKEIPMQLLVDLVTGGPITKARAAVVVDADLANDADLKKLA